MIYNRLQYTVLLGLLIYFFLENIWGVRFTTSDDSSIMLWAQHDLKEQFNIIDNIAKDQARLYFYYHVWYLIFVQSFWDTIFYDLIQTGSHLLSIILITYTLKLYTNNKHYFLYPLIYISITTITWEHTLTTSVPLYHFIYLIKLCLIFILIFKYKENPSYIKLICLYIIYCLSIIGQEYQLFVSFFSILLSCYLLKNKTFIYKIIYPTAIIALAYCIAIILFYISYNPGYDGADIDLNKFNITHFFGLIIEWSLSGNIFFMLFDEYELLLDLNFNNKFTNRIPVINQISFSAYSLLYIIIIYYLFKLIDTWSNPVLRNQKNKFIIFIYFLIIIILPQFFLALTPKYQLWYSIGEPRYTYTSLSNFALCIVLNIIISQLLNTYNYIAKTVIFIIISIVYIFNNEFNNITSNAMKESSSKWIAWDIFMNSPYYNSQKSIRAPRFSHRFWYTQNFEKYWNSLTQTLYQSNTKLLIENNNLSSDTNYFIDYYNFKNNVIVIYGELLNYDYLINPVLLTNVEHEYIFDYINKNNHIIRSKLRFNKLSNNLFEYKIRDIVRLNTVRFTKKFLNGYVYSINNLLNIDDKVEFTDDSAKSFYLGNEWSNIEDGGIWGYGEHSSINFSVREVENCMPFIEFSIEPIQSNYNSKINLILNDKLIKVFRPIPKIKTYIIDLNKTIFNKSNILIFKNNISASPQSLNMGADNRLLSFRMYYFKISCK